MDTDTETQVPRLNLFSAGSDTGTWACDELPELASNLAALWHAQRQEGEDEKLPESRIKRFRIASLKATIWTNQGRVARSIQQHFLQTGEFRYEEDFKEWLGTTPEWLAMDGYEEATQIWLKIHDDGIPSATPPQETSRQSIGMPEEDACSCGPECGLEGLPPRFRDEDEDEITDEMRERMRKHDKLKEIERGVLAYLKYDRERVEDGESLSLAIKEALEQFVLWVKGKEEMGSGEEIIDKIRETGAARKEDETIYWLRQYCRCLMDPDLEGQPGAKLGADSEILERVRWLLESG